MDNNGYLPRRGNMLIENRKCILGKLQRSDIEDSKIIALL
jgi:hypothetical protein